MRHSQAILVLSILCLGIIFQSGILISTQGIVSDFQSTSDTGTYFEDVPARPSLDVDEQMWNLTYGGSGDDAIQSISNCSDGGYIMVGWTSSFGVTNDLWLVKVDQSGNFLWNKTYNSMYTHGFDVIECQSGGFAIAGWYGDIILNAEMLLLRTDSSGNELWRKTFGYTGDDQANSILEISTGGFLLTGVIYADNPTKHASILLWTDSSGNHIRNTTYTFGTGDIYTYLFDTIECSNGGFLTVGTTIESVSSLLVVRTNAIGSISWYDYYGSGVALSVLENSDYDFVLCGYNNSGMIFKELDKAGTQTLSKIYDFQHIENSIGTEIVEHPPGGYVIAGIVDYGYSTANATVLKIQSNGNEEWNTTLPMGGSEARGVYIAEDLSIVLAGTRDLRGIDTNGWILSMPSFDWDVAPEDWSIERDLGYTLDASTSMDMFTDLWWLDNALLDVDQDGVISTPAPLPLGDFEFNLFVHDIMNRTLKANFWLHVEDNLAPQWTVTPSNQEHEYGTVFDYDLHAIDTSGVIYWINDTINFEHLGDGLIESNGILQLGVYPLRMNVSDSYGNMDTAEFTVTILDTTFPVLEGLQDIIKEYSVIDYIMQWNCSDLLPAYFIITRNGAEINSGTWNGSDLRVRLDGLALGLYTFNLIINDTSDNLVEDEVLVTIADLIVPIIDHPQDIWYLEGGVGSSITWNPQDLFPTSYRIFVDDVEVDSGAWDGSTITYSVDGLAPGVHNCTIVLYDIGDNLVTDYVQVTVLDWPDYVPTTPPSTTTTTGNTTPADLIDYIRGIEGTFTLGLTLVGVLAGAAIIVGAINIILMRKMKPST
ncbi:MAG: hypothetical protein RTV31_03555 [Candidatus Thorarchaeota archaeon]